MRFSRRGAIQIYIYFYFLFLLLSLHTAVAPWWKATGKGRCGVFAWVYESCVIHTWALQRWVPNCGALYKCLSFYRSIIVAFMTIRWSYIWFTNHRQPNKQTDDEVRFAVRRSVAWKASCGELKRSSWMDPINTNRAVYIGRWSPGAVKSQVPSLQCIEASSSSSRMEFLCAVPVDSNDLITHARPGVKPGFHYSSWRPELTARVDGWPVSITRQHGPCWRARVSTSRVDGPE